MNLFDTASARTLSPVPMPDDEEFRRDYLLRRRPAVFDRVVERLPVAKDWSLENFASRLDMIRVQRPAEDGLYHYLHFDRMPFAEFRELLKGENKAYAFETLIDPKQSELKGVADARDARLPGFIPMSSLYSSNLWIGSGSNKSLLHYDHVDSLLVMVEGRKRFLLFPPERTRSMYPYGILDFRSIKEGRVLDSRVNAGQVDLERFPRLKGVQGLRGELHAGQALFIPAGTWHYIHSYDLNVAVNFFWHGTRWPHWLRRPLLDYLLKRRIVVAIDQLRRLKRAVQGILQRSVEGAG